MDFQQSFINALQTNIARTKTIFIQNYLPTSLSTPVTIERILPFVQAYGNITTSYPYNYQLSNLDSYCLLYTEKGIGTLLLEDCNYTLAPNTFAFINCHLLHVIEVKQFPWNYKVFFINGDSIPFLYLNFIKDYGNIHVFLPGSDLPNQIQKFFLQLVNNPDDIFLQAKYLNNIILEVIIEKNRLLEPNNSIPNYLDEIKCDFDTNYQNRFSLNSLEQRYHISKYRICREFTEYFDSPPIQYLNHKRIEVAKEALVYTDKRINEIGRMVGIENTNHFIRLFKQQTGVTPLFYRRTTPAIISNH